MPNLKSKPWTDSIAGFNTNRLCVEIDREAIIDFYQAGLPEKIHADKMSIQKKVITIQIMESSPCFLQAIPWGCTGWPVSSSLMKHSSFSKHRKIGLKTMAVLIGKNIVEQLKYLTIFNQSTYWVRLLT